MTYTIEVTRRRGMPLTARCVIFAASEAEAIEKSGPWPRGCTFRQVRTIDYRERLEQ